MFLKQFQNYWKGEVFIGTTKNACENLRYSLATALDHYNETQTAMCVQT